MHMLIAVRGLNNIGLLVKTFGRVVSSEADEFYVDDGSGFDYGDPNVPGLRVTVPAGTSAPAVGSYVAVTGISSCYKDGADLYRLLRVREQTDILPLQ